MEINVIRDTKIGDCALELVCKREFHRHNFNFTNLWTRQWLEAIKPGSTHLPRSAWFALSIFDEIGEIEYSNEWKHVFFLFDGLLPCPDVSFNAEKGAKKIQTKRLDMLV